MYTARAAAVRLQIQPGTFTVHLNPLMLLNHAASETARLPLTCSLALAHASFVQVLRALHAFHHFYPLSTLRINLCCDLPLAPLCLVLFLLSCTSPLYSPPYVFCPGGMVVPHNIRFLNHRILLRLA